MIQEFDSQVRYSECDQDANLSLGGIVNYFQDVSSFQGEDGGIGIDYLQENHLAWILSFWQIIIRRRPRIAEKIKAQTWAYGFNSFYGLRNFTLLDARGEKAAYANSVWVLMDTERLRPVKANQKMLDTYGVEEPLKMDYAPRKVREPQDMVPGERFEVVRYHLDTNHHVNNGQYISMAQESLPEGFPIREIRVEYKKQAHLGDGITPYTYEDKNRMTVSLRSDEGKTYAVAEFLRACGED